MLRNLKRHQKHECGKEKSFGCDMCKYRCFRRNVLVLHYRKKHPTVEAIVTSNCFIATAEKCT
ncbi:unnamed protein product [Acanthoscelides obtectus]|uniref:C2H2-type domain-containing protein n=1 Tax=Acanthoscelides obtectus TaxID=200917 RepID=A0A9P0JZD7_ACAOB|nr:unnamed protein product [Acanthoscelides obtectus]CAK1669735.1 hypothetical protein AOBTE_LOCUS27212 [Acanthoscelides obtectus]